MSGSIAASEDAGRYGVVKQRLEVPMLVLALVMIPALGLELYSPSDTLQQAARAVNNLIWVAFALEYAVLLWLAERKRQHVTSHQLDLAIVLLSSPLLLTVYPQAGAVRMLRLLRVAGRLGRLIAAALKALRGTSRILTRHGSHYVAAVALVTIIVAGISFAMLENGADKGIKELMDGLWWAITTVTTVGYGDVYPGTGEGRVLAVVLMLVGIGLLSVVTANIASLFVMQDQKAADQHILEKLGEIVGRLDRLEDRIVTRPGNGDELSTTDRAQRGMSSKSEGC